jgi:ornithine--oxo-acid transaminase
MTLTSDHIQITEQYGAHNYAPLPVVLERGEGSWVWDVEGKKYFDMMSAYSAVNFGHCNPRFKATAVRQLEKLTMVSRAFLHEHLGMFFRELAELSGTEMVLPMNSGAEAVETALKCARRWGYQKKGVAENCAEIICFSNNFAGRTISIISFSTEPAYQQGFGPLTPGFVIAQYGDIADVRAKISKNTVAVLIEPIQGEGGIIIPPPGFLKELRDICTQEKILFVADEIQTGLCRTGKVFACEHEGVVPDLYVIGKSLGAGITPISAIMGSREVIGVFNPGSHGSTFGGNSFACAVARDVIAYIQQELPQDRALSLGAHAIKRLNAQPLSKVEEIRGRGLMIGIDIKKSCGKAKYICEALLADGVLCKDTRQQTIRLTPPVTTLPADLDWALDRVIMQLS